MDNFGIAKTFPAWLARFLLSWHLLPGSATLLKYFSTSLKDVVDSFVTSAELKAILCYCFGDYGVPPSKAPFAMQVFVKVHNVFLIPDSFSVRFLQDVRLFFCLLVV